MRLYVGNLPWDVRTRDLERLFDEFGEIRDIDIHSSFAFVEYYNWRDADDAIYYLDNTRFMGERIRVEEARDRGRAPSPPRRSNYRIVVENLSPSISWQDLKDYFRRAGEIVFADVYRSREEGVVEFAHYDDFKYALEKYDDTRLDGRRIRLYDDRPRRRSRSRSRERSRSRSRSRTPARDRSRTRSRSVSRRRSVTPRKESTRRSRSRSPVATNTKGGDDSKSVRSGRDSGNESEASPRAAEEEKADVRAEVQVVQASA